MTELTRSAGGKPTRESSTPRDRTIQEISPHADFGLGLVCIHSLDGHLLSVSPVGARVLGYRPDEMVGRPMQDFLPPDVRDQLPAYLETMQKNGTASGLMRVLTKSGEERILAYSNICRHESGKPPYVLGHAADITDFKRTEHQLRVAEQRSRHLLQCSSDVVTIAQSDGSIQFISPVVERVLGYSPEALVGQNIFDFVHVADLSLARDAFAAALGRPGYAPSIEIRLRDVRGEYIDFEVVANNLLSMPAVAGIVIAAKNLSARKTAESELEKQKEELEQRDRQHTAELAKINERLLAQIKEREQVEHALRESQSLLQAALESTADGILVVDLQGNIVSINRRCSEMWNIPEDILKARRDEQALSFVLDQLKSPPQFISKVTALYANPTESSYDVLEFKDGRVFERYSQAQKIGGKTVGRVWSFRDVTEQRRLEDHLRQAQKMEAIGRLAGGIAHDFNNLLMVIMGHCDILRAGEGTVMRHSIDEIFSAAMRAASLTRQLLAFSRRQVLEPRLLDLNAVLGNLSTMLRRLIAADIELVMSLSELPVYVSADPAQLDQVIMNLAVNARDAMPKGGRLTVHVTAVDLSVPCAKGAASVPAGAYVLLKVSDTGTGMSQKTLSRIFEPFFTTKELGQGAGLGLATTYGIVRQSNGYILVESVIGQGTTFEIYLPRVEAASIVSGTPLCPPAGPCRGSETILLAEDQESLRILTKSFLEQEGYTVLEAETGLEALSLVDGYPGPIHLLVTDLVMPGIRGTEFAERLLERRPNVPVIYISGYSDEEITDPAAAFIQKPFRLQELGAKIRSILDRIRSSAA